jgi:hypothetical protein
MKKYGRVLVMLLGIYMACFGLGGMSYSRSGQPVYGVEIAFHPWAVFIGLLMIGLAYWMGRTKR